MMLCQGTAAYNEPSHMQSRLEEAQKARAEAEAQCSKLGFELDPARQSFEMLAHAQDELARRVFANVGLERLVARWHAHYIYIYF